MKQTHTSKTDGEKTQATLDKFQPTATGIYIVQCSTNWAREAAHRGGMLFTCIQSHTQQCSHHPEHTVHTIML